MSTRTFEVLLDVLAGAVDETVGEMARAIREEFPVYDRFRNPEDERAWRSGLRATLELFVELSRTGRGLNTEERRGIAAIGEARAEQGVRLDVVLGSVRMAMHVALCAVRNDAPSYVRSSGDFEAAMDEMSLRMTRFVNDFSTELSSGHIARSEARATTLERDRAQFGSDLLAGAFGTYAEVASQGEVLGLDVPPTLGLVLVPASGPTHALLTADLRRAVQSALVLPIGWEALPHTVLIVPAATAGAWADAKKQVADVVSRHRVAALVAGPCEQPPEWHVHYVEASASLGLVARFADGRSLVDARELVPAQVVASASSATLSAIEREVLAPIHRHSKGAKLLRALDALMRADGSPKAAARLLGVTSETARTYRATIEEVTSLSFDRPADAMRLGLGWLVLRRSDENTSDIGETLVRTRISI